MKCVRKITEDLYYVGASDRRIALFENIFPIPEGVAYNSYLLLDEKNVLLDSVDYSIGRQFLENIRAVLAGGSLDYIIVNHMEPDHCALLEQLAGYYPDVKLVGNAKTLQFFRQFYHVELADRFLTVAEGDTIVTGKHHLKFLMAPMVHWPETMATYDETDQVLFSADAFGSFRALDGRIFADEMDFERDWLSEARRYYANIVGKYGVQVQALLKKAPADLKFICPLHGPVWRKGLPRIVEKYDLWSRYEPEERGVAVIYASMYGNTENAASRLALELAERGVGNLSLFDVSGTHVSVLIAEIFKMSHVVLASPTYNAGIYPVMKNLLEDMKALNVQNRTAAVIENGTWAPVSGKLMRAELSEMKNMRILEQGVTIRSSGAEAQEAEIMALADLLASDILQG